MFVLLPSDRGLRLGTGRERTPNLPTKIIPTETRLLDWTFPGNSLWT